MGLIVRVVVGGVCLCIGVLSCLFAYAVVYLFVRLLGCLFLFVCAWVLVVIGGVCLLVRLIGCLFGRASVCLFVGWWVGLSWVFADVLVWLRGCSHVRCVFACLVYGVIVGGLFVCVLVWLFVWPCVCFFACLRVCLFASSCV